MTAVDLRRDPHEVARAVLEAHAGDAEWLDAFSGSLDRRRAGRQLARVLSVWGLSQSDAGHRFGVSRQAVAKWLAAGVPVERAASVADLAAATDVLVHYLRRDRIPAVVRRPAPQLGDASLLDLVAEGRTSEVVAACRAMFDFAAVHA